jgi:MoxR-like ATPase
VSGTLAAVVLPYPSELEEREVARRTTSEQTLEVPKVLTAEEVRALQGLVPRIPGSRGTPKEVREYVRFGAGPRGSQALVLAAKARAALRGEAAADIDDVRAMVMPVLRHRLVLSYRADAEGVRDADILQRVLESVK